MIIITTVAETLDNSIENGACHSRTFDTSVSCVCWALKWFSGICARAHSIRFTVWENGKGILYALWLAKWQMPHKRRNRKEKWKMPNSRMKMERNANTRNMWKTASQAHVHDGDVPLATHKRAFCARCSCGERQRYCLHLPFGRLISDKTKLFKQTYSRALPRHPNIIIIYAVEWMGKCRGGRKERMLQSGMK